VRGIFLEVPERWLADRHSRGADKWDEMWEGVLHCPPVPDGHHQDFVSELMDALGPTADQQGLKIAPFAVVVSADDWRLPDITIAPPSSLTERGVERPPFVAIEVKGPIDESDEKVPWYLDRGARSVVVVDQHSFSVEVFTSTGPVSADPDGMTVVPGLGLRVGPAEDGGALLVQTDEGTQRVTG
jgi:Putative restriction endonuclease